jgi:hypothetical protein
MPLSKEIGTPSVFAGDIIVNAEALPNSTTKNSNEFEINNVLGLIKIVGRINTALTVTAALSFKLQYKDSGGNWFDDVTVYSVSTGSLTAGSTLFTAIVPPSTEKRIYRIVTTTAFNASAATYSVELQYNPAN